VARLGPHFRRASHRSTAARARRRGRVQQRRRDAVGITHAPRHVAQRKSIERSESHAGSGLRSDREGPYESDARD
jgi:hypothetical protein